MDTNKLPCFKGVTFSKPSFWVSMLVFGGVNISSRMKRCPLDVFLEISNCCLKGNIWERYPRKLTRQWKLTHFLKRRCIFKGLFVPLLCDRLPECISNPTGLSSFCCGLQSLKLSSERGRFNLSCDRYTC